MMNPYMMRSCSLTPTGYRTRNGIIRIERSPLREFDCSTEVCLFQVLPRHHRLSAVPERGGGRMARPGERLPREIQNVELPIANEFSVETADS